MTWDQLTPLLGKAFGETMSMVLTALVVGGFFGLLIGVGLYTTRRGNILENRWVFAVLNIAVNIVRPIPFIIFLVALRPVIKVFVGKTIGIEAFTFAMCFMATFACARLVEQNLIATDPGVIEAARAMGASPLRIIVTVLIPEALSPLILGYTFLFVGILDISALGGIIGAGGLGDLALVYGYRQFDTTVTVVVVVIIIVIVQLAQFLGNTLARRMLRR